MRGTPRLKFARTFIILAGLAGLGAAALPVLSQTSPSPSPSPRMSPTPGMMMSPSPGMTHSPGMMMSPSPGMMSPSPRTDRPGNITPDSPNRDTSSPSPGMMSPSPGMMSPSPGMMSPTPRPPSPSPSRTPSPSPTRTPSPSPTRTPSPSPTGNTSSRSIGELLQQASNSGSCRTLARIIQESGLGGTLQSRGGNYTILAPTDEAFSRLPAGTLDRLLRPENRSLLARVLAYHVIPGRVTSSQIRTGSVSTLGGGIAVRVASGRVIINDASVVQPDIQASNGVIHGISRVLMSRELRQQVLSLR